MHLAKENLKGFLVSIGLLICCSLIAYQIAGILSVITTIVIIFMSLSDFYLPVRYIITSDSVASISFLKKNEILWRDVKKCYLDKYGIKISPLDKLTTLEAFRGVYLRFNNNDNEVKSIVKELFDSAGNQEL